MSTFALLWGKILESSLWVQESKETRLVWITILAMKDKDGVVEASVVGLADRAKVTPKECEAALKVLTSPDANDTSGVEKGVRLKRVQGGWKVVNNDLYRFSTEARRELWRQTKADQRTKAGAGKRVKHTMLPGAASAEKMARRDVSQVEIDKFQETTLPEHSGGKGVQ